MKAGQAFAPVSLRTANVGQFRPTRATRFCSSRLKKSSAFWSISHPILSRTEHTIRRYQNRAIEAAAVIEELIQLAKQMRKANKRGEDLKLSDDELSWLPRSRSVGLCPFTS